MPFHKISRDVKLAAVNLYEREILSLEQILECVEFSERTFWRILKLWRENGISCKQLKKIVKEQNEVQCADFIRHMAQYEPEELVFFLDETSKDERTQSRRFGRAKKGLGLLTVDGMIASSVGEGSFITEKFMTFIEEDVLPLCFPYPGKLSVLVMDNASCHHDDGVAELIYEAGRHLNFVFE
ncbi:uncharacterized protein HD556DRAFT_1435081 [Suillus plorans]|uniref:Tc1-like transposase DDE domain-containing protein n=1 Tax=Suillus plorans TaxID=116603 RepID=A0A9P7DBE2_9AGAM|nr:uncharacterized protein HD556DRAFT_1435081 [Suillus plorans]KAG1785611.1 hypothetical protein HD556DRAFT_1435081 [Suillus plorans]